MLAFGLLAVGCDGDDEAVSTTTAPSTTTTGPTENGTAAAGCEAEGTVRPKEAEPEGGPLYLSDVSFMTAEAGCVEQIAFSFEEAGQGALGYKVEYAEGPFEDPGGQVARVEGEAFLRVVLLNGTAVDLSREEPRETFAGLPTPSGDFVVDLVSVSDFEAASEWVIGLDTPGHPFEVEYDADDRSLAVNVWAA